MGTIHSLDEFRQRKERAKRQKLDEAVMERARHLSGSAQKPRGFGAWIKDFIGHGLEERDEDPKDTK